MQVGPKTRQEIILYLEVRYQDRKSQGIVKMNLIELAKLIGTLEALEDILIRQESRDADIPPLSNI